MTKNLGVWTCNEPAPVAPWHTDSIPCKGGKGCTGCQTNLCTKSRYSFTTEKLRKFSWEATICARREPQIPTILAGQSHRCSYTKFRMSWLELVLRPCCQSGSCFHCRISPALKSRVFVQTRCCLAGPCRNGHFLTENADFHHLLEANRCRCWEVS